MKTKKIFLLIVFILGIISLLLLSSFINRNACEYAYSNIEYIKTELEKAIVAEDPEMGKYHAFKALNSIEKTKSNFLDCGCEGTIESLENALSHLKSATSAPSYEDSKEWLHLALENIMIGIRVLRVFEQEISSDYGDNVLVLNTRDAIENQAGIILPQGNLKEVVHNCLLGFETSLDKVVKEVECHEAHKFISKIHDETQLTLLNTDLSVAKKQYHQRVKTLTQDALEKLGECSVD